MKKIIEDKKTKKIEKEKLLIKIFKENYFDYKLNKDLNEKLEYNYNDIFIDIVKYDYHNLLEEFLKYKVFPINEKIISSCSFIHISSSENNIRVTEILLNHGANIDQIDINGCSALHMAVSIKSEKMIKFLLENNAKLLFNFMKVTPLDFALEYDDDKLSNLIIEKTVNLKEIINKELYNLNSGNSRYYNYLHKAIDNGKYTIAKKLIDKGADVNFEFTNNKITLLTNYVQLHNYEAVKFLLENGASLDLPNVKGLTSFYEAIVYSNKNMEMIKAWKRDNIMINYNYTHPYFGTNYIQIAALFNKPAVIQFLHDEKSCEFELKTKDGSTPIFYSIIGKEDCVEAFEKLIELNVNNLEVVDEKNNNLLHLAAKFKKIKIIKVLVTKYKFDVNTPNENNNTPFQLFIDNEKLDDNDIEMVKFLIENGANNTINSEGNNCFHIASSRGHIKIISELKKMSGEKSSEEYINDLNGNGNTPLMIAVVTTEKDNIIDVIKLLLHHKPKLELKNDDGNNVVHLAVLVNKPEILKLFIDNISNTTSVEEQKSILNAENKEGSTPIALAEKKENREIKKILNTWNVKLNGTVKKDLKAKNYDSTPNYTQLPKKHLVNLVVL